MLRIGATIGGVNLNPSIFKFSGGEYQVKIRDIKLPIPHGDVIITMWNLSGDIMPLSLVVDAIKRHFGKNITSMTLTLPYLPYARQDRVMSAGESLAVKVFADHLNQLGFDSVLIDDCHSDVGMAVINNVSPLPSSTSSIVGTGFDALVAPDAGALKKTIKLAKELGIKEVIRADKIRDVESGEITGTEVFGEVTGKNLLISDDICDGGRTFIELAKVLKERGAANIHLHVTHGIFSKGKSVFDGLIDKVTSTYDYEEMFK